MKHFEKTIKFFVLTLLAFSTVTLSYSIAEAGCYAESTLTAQEIKITPESNCFEVELSDDVCTGSIRIEFTNNYEDTSRWWATNFLTKKSPPWEL